MKNNSGIYTELINSSHFSSNNKFCYPQGNLIDYISYYWETDLLFKRPDIIEEKFLPLPTYSLIVNLGTAYRIVVDGKLHRIRQDILLLRTKANKYIFVKGNKIFGIHFKTDLLNLFINPGQANHFPYVVQLIDHYEELANLAASIRARVNFEERVETTEEYLADMVSKLTRSKKLKLKYVLANIHDIQHSVIGSMNISEAALNQSLTLKSLERYYLSIVGITPKLYWRISRFRKALADYYLKEKKFSPQEFGYHDYSHFYREFVEMTGVSPSDMLKSDFS